MFPKTTSILIVDDMPSIRYLVKSALRTLAYDRIYEASDGEVGYKILMESYRSDSPIQVIISDWNMPKMNGLEFLKKVRSKKELEQLPFILLTSESEREQVAEAVLAGASQYIIKPFSAKVFEDKLKAAYLRHNKDN